MRAGDGRGRASVVPADLSDEEDRGQDPGRIGAGLHERFNRNFADGVLITPERCAAALLAHLPGDDTGAIWDVSIGSVRT